MHSQLCCHLSKDSGGKHKHKVEVFLVFKVARCTWHSRQSIVTLVQDLGLITQIDGGDFFSSLVINVIKVRIFQRSIQISVAYLTFFV